MNRLWTTSIIVLLASAPLSAQAPAGGDLDAIEEQAMRSAMLKVAPCIVQIETSGGTDLVGSGPRGPQIRKGTGPTTGLIVAADGYIISSSFNFVNKPTAIFVAVPGHKDHFPAQVVATDTTRMVTLLKIDAKGLQVPVAAPKKDIKVGQTALALGRTWSVIDLPPSISVGIVSALKRIWGKAIQTDAKVSPVNYGGPLVDIQGRVLGVMVPASPASQDETAGVEWYDSGIGFAIPLEDINAVLPRLKEGKDLKRGMMGITSQNQQDPYGAVPIVATVIPQSAAAEAGIKPGDTIIEIDGTKVSRHSQVLHLIGPKYEGDKISIKVKRGDKELAFKNVVLTGDLPARAIAFLGILPMRDDPELGVEVRYVFPKSPADEAGIKAGDRILTLGQDKTPQGFSGRDELMARLAAMLPGTEVKLEVRPANAKEPVLKSLKLAALSDVLPNAVPQAATLKKALEPRKEVKAKPKKPVVAKPTPPKKDAEPKKDPTKKPETGLLKRSNTARDHEYWVYVPEDYDPNIAYALVVWLHGPARGKDRDKDAETMSDRWEGFCADHHIIMVGPKAQNESGWLASESDFVREAINAVINDYTIDRQRIIAHGFDSGGQMAYRMGFRDRDLIRAVAAAGAALPLKPSDSQANARLSFFIMVGDKDPLAKLVETGRDQILEHKLPLVYRRIPNMGHQYPDDAMLGELVRWMDTLDRL